MNGGLIRGEVVDAQNLPADQAALWGQWCGENPALSRAFLSYDFVSAAARVLRRVRVAVLYRSGRTVAFFPFQFASRWKQAAGWAEPCAFGLSDSFGLVAARGFRISPAGLLRASGVNHLYFDHLDSAQREFGLQGEIRRPGLLIQLGGGPEEYWRTCSAKDKEFVQDTLRRERQLASRVGPLHFSLTDSAADLDFLIAQKRRQYAATGVPDPLAPPWARQLLHRLLRIDSLQCRPMLAVLRAGSTWVASHFGLRFLDRLHYWFPVYNPELRRYAPGRLLLKAVIDRSAELNISTIDRGEGESMAKADFATAAVQYECGAWTRWNPAGASARIVQSVQWRLRRLHAAHQAPGKPVAAER